MDIITIKNIYPFFILFYIFTIGLFTFYEYKKISDIKKNWSLYVLKISEKDHLIDELNSHIGYGGLIHNFKNYLIRSRNDYLDKANSDYLYTQKILATIYKKFTLNKEEKFHLQNIEDTLNQYGQNLQKLKDIKTKDYSIKKQDDFIVVDDTNALKAFKFFKYNISLERKKNINYINKVFRSSKLWFISIIITSTFIFLTLFTILFHHLKKTSLKLNIEQQKNIDYTRNSAIKKTSSNIAHEINNPLAIVYGNIELIKNKIKKDPIDRLGLEKNMTTITNTLKRISDMTNVLRTISQMSNDEPKIEFSIKQLLDEIILHNFSIYNEINFIMELPREDLVYGQRGQVQNGLNLLLKYSVNSVKDTPQAWVKIILESSKNCKLIKIIDSAPPIDKELNFNIEETLFSVKQQQGELCFGLSLAKNIFEQHQGRFIIGDKKSGFNFCIELPTNAETKKNIHAA